MSVGVYLLQVAHIVVTLLYAPPEVRFHPSTWTVLLWGNIVGTAMPAVARSVRTSISNASSIAFADQR